MQTQILDSNEPKKMKWIVWTTALFFLGLSLLNIHGFSFPAWSRILNEPQNNPTLLGHARDMRGDDWWIGLPLIFSQMHSHPKGPIKNTLVGEEQDMIFNIYPVPLKHWGSFFRPQTWGYWISEDFGMAWHWNFYVLGLFLATFLLAFELSKRTTESLLIAICFVFAPYFQFWSFINAPFVIFSFFACWGLFHLIDAPSISRRILFSFFSTYFLAAFGLQLYPPTQIPLIVMLLSFCFFKLKTNGPFFEKGTTARNYSLLVVGIISALLAGKYLYESREVLKIMTLTGYPGNRRTLPGAGISTFLLIFGNLVRMQKMPHFITLGNICEAAGFLFVFPLLFFRKSFYQLARSSHPITSTAHKKSPEEQIAFGTAWVLLLVFMVYQLVPLPRFVADITGFGLLSPNRTIVAYGLVNFFALIGFARFNYDTRDMKKREPHYWIGSSIWIGITLIYCYQLRWIHNIPYPVLLFSLFTLAFPYVFKKFSYRKTLIFLMGATLLQTAGFNPIVKGGYQSIIDRSESIRKLRLIQESAPGKWIFVNTKVESNLPRMLGIPSIGGTLFYPQFSFWNQLDKNSKFRDAYNRYCHVIFLDRPKEKFSIRADPPDTCVVRFSKINELDTLDYRYVVYQGDVENFQQRNPSFRRLADLNWSGHTAVFLRPKMR